MNGINRPTAILLSIMILIVGIGVFIMPNERNYYVICDDNCRFPAMTKEEVIAAIEAATGHVPSEEEIDQAFITKIKELNANSELKWWLGTEAQYNALSEKDTHTLYIITDASEYDDFAAELESALQDIEQFKTDVNEDIAEFKTTCKIKGDFAVIKGSVEMESGSGGAKVNYPNGFNKDNCVVISVGTNKAISGGAEPTKYNFGGYNYDVSDISRGTIPRVVCLRDNDILVEYISNDEEQTTKYWFKIVLMKV